MAKTKKRKTTTPRRSSAPTSIVVRAPEPRAPARRASTTINERIYVAPQTSLFRRRPSGSAASNAHKGARVRKGVAVAGAVIGFLDRSGGMLSQVEAKMPGGTSTTKKAIIALGLHHLAKKRPGGYMDHAATAMTAIAAYQVGRDGITALSLSGPGDDTHAHF